MHAPRRPIALRGRFLWTFHFTFRAPEEILRSQVPPSLEPITHRGWAFWDVAVSEFLHLRPALVPLPIGLRGHCAAYRIYARYRPADGQPTDGMYFVRCDCDHPLAASLAPLVSDVPLHAAGFDIVDDQAGRLLVEIDSEDASARVLLDTRRRPRLPADSPFDSLSDSARFFRNSARSLSVDPSGRVYLREFSCDDAEGKSRFVHMDHLDWRFFQNQTLIPEICYEVKHTHCTWSRPRKLTSGPGSAA